MGRSEDVDRKSKPRSIANPDAISIEQDKNHSSGTPGRRCRF
jgi:hypothetical protein